MTNSAPHQLPPSAYLPVLLLDAAVILVTTVALCLASAHPRFMLALVLSLFFLRLSALALVSSRSRSPALLTDLLFLLFCSLLGAFNDWNSVVRHGVYDYSVPVLFPAFSTVPLWMLLYWGFILRFLASLASIGALRPSAASGDCVRLGPFVRTSPLLKVSLELLLLVATRQAIYAFHGDPVLSWLPFAVALLLYLLLFGVDGPRARLLLLVLVVGPAVEILYIQVAHLHRYALGWLAGVPLWIVLWWGLAVLIWADIAPRIQGRLALWLSPRRAWAR